MTSPAMIVLDGGMGRELHRIGAPFRQPEWSALALMEGPEYVEQVHAAYIAAGADVITSNSYAVVPYHIGEDRFSAHGQALADLAGRLGRQAIAAGGRPVRLAGSLPPVFGSYRPDLFRPEDADRILQPLVAGLSPHVDLWLAETQSCIAEAEAARRAVGPDDDRPFWLSFTVSDETPAAVADGTAPPTLRSGESVRDAAAAALRLKAAALLFNCSHGDVMAATVREASAVFGTVPKADRPRLGVYANAFVPQDHAEEANETISTLRDDFGPQEYLRAARHWQAAGASIIGGCCGVGPETIALLAAGLRGA